MLTLIMLARMEAFAHECKDLSSNQIYEKFEHEIADDLRDALYDLGSLANPNSTEPCRSSMICLGENYNIQSLKDY